jgi:hypothetical protein
MDFFKKAKMGQKVELQIFYAAGAGTRVDYFVIFTDPTSAPKVIYNSTQQNNASPNKIGISSQMKEGVNFIDVKFQNQFSTPNAASSYTKEGFKLFVDDVEVLDYDQYQEDGCCYPTVTCPTVYLKVS